MLPLILHHLERARRGASYKALKNCHVRGVYSVVLHDEPGNRIRMFHAKRGNHSLWHNRDELHLAIHPHHCDLTLVGLYGLAYNDVYAIVPHATGTHAEYIYKSAITTDRGSMEATGERAYVHRLRSDLIGPEGIVMRAHELHTVYLDCCEGAAWLVIEGAEDPSYKSRCWTNGNVSLDGLYEPMDSAEVTAILASVRLRMGKPQA